MRMVKWFCPKPGQGLLEYALILALVVVIVVLGLSLSGTSLSDVYCAVLNGLNEDGGCSQRLLSDPFGDPEDWKQVWGTGSVDIANDKMTMKGDARVLNKRSYPGDIKITVDIATLLSGDGYGVMFRMHQNGKNFSGYSFQVDPGLGNQFCFRRFDKNGAELSTPLSTSRPPAGFDWNAPHKIEVVVKGNTFQAYVDGSLVLTAQDNTYKSGQVGFRTWDSSVATYGKLTVSKP